MVPGEPFAVFRVPSPFNFEILCPKSEVLIPIEMSEWQEEHLVVYIDHYFSNPRRQDNVLSAPSVEILIAFIDLNGFCFGYF